MNFGTQTLDLPIELFQSQTRPVHAPFSNSFELSLDEEESGVVTLGMTIFRASNSNFISWSKKLTLSGLIYLFEIRNEDIKKYIKFRAELYSEISDFDEAVIHDVDSSGLGAVRGAGTMDDEVSCFSNWLPGFGEVVRVGLGGGGE